MTEPEKILVYSRSQIEEKIGGLAEQLSREYAESAPVLVGILNGVFMFYSDLVKALSIPVFVDFVRLASYGSNAESSGLIKLTKDVEIDLRGRDVVIVEDIADSGLTLAYLRDHLMKKGARSVKICVLIDKIERRHVEVPLDFVGFKVESGFLVGYGLDFNEQYRYLPEIYCLRMA